MLSSASAADSGSAAFGGLVAPKASKASKAASTAPFREQHSFSQRSMESQKIRATHPECVPVICAKDPRSDVPAIDKQKFLVPQQLTVGQFGFVIRKRIKLPSEKALLLFVNDMVPPTASLMKAIYEEQKDTDGFLYITYSGENTFGQEFISLDASGEEEEQEQEDVE